MERVGIKGGNTSTFRCIHKMGKPCTITWTPSCRGPSVISRCGGRSLWISQYLSKHLDGLCRRYFICDKKLAALGWREKIDWEEGLQSTVNWYLENGFNDYWDNGDVEQVIPGFFPLNPFKKEHDLPWLRFSDVYFRRSLRSEVLLAFHCCVSLSKFCRTLCEVSAIASCCVM